MPSILAQILVAILPSLGQLLVDILNRFSQPGASGQSLFERAVQLATWHVQNMVQSDASGDEKRRMATEALAADFKREGLAVETSMLNLAIEWAYNGLKAVTPAVPAPKAPA